jgi:hypothetical protein
MNELLHVSSTRVNGCNWDDCGSDGVVTMAGLSSRYHRHLPRTYKERGHEVPATPEQKNIQSFITTLASDASVSGKPEMRRKDEVVAT